jgi:hypothetical protein
MTIISAELVWTRIFSAEFFYTFAFLTLSIAVMGLGLGGLALRLFGFLHHRWVLGIALSLTGASALAGPPLVFRLGVDFSSLYGNASMIARFVAMLALLGSTFFFGGVALATVFKRGHTDIPRLYMADLVGAGVAVLLSVAAMNVLGTPVAVFWSALPILLAALVASRGGWRLLPVALIVVMVLLAGRGEQLLEAPREERATVIYKHWDAMAKVKAYDYDGEGRGINIDNVANSPVLQFDGDWDSLYARYPEGLPWLIDVGYLIERFEDCRFLSLGCGGGWDVMQALDKGATDIHAVDVNPHIVKMLRDGDPDGYISRDSTVVDSAGNVITMAEYSGHVFRDPRVTHVAEDARTYVRRHNNRFDLIFSLSSNTWAALGSGAFALAENYLFTTEAFRDYWNALSDDGFLSMEHQVYMPRLVTQALDALEMEGVERPREHIAVYNLPSMRRNVLLMSKRPLTEEIRQNAYGPLSPEVHEERHLLYPAADSLQDNLVNRIVTNGWRAEADSAAVDLSPCTDDRPFIAQMGLWRNLDREKLGELSKYAEFYGFPVSKLTVAIILAITLVVVIPLNLLPYIRARGPTLRAVPWLYFFLIGLAFMAVEVVLIQRYTLFIGASVYSIAVVLFTLLVAGGVGSRYSRRVGDNAAIIGILLWLALEVAVLRPLTGALAALPVYARVLVSAVLVFPLGFFMGMPFPKGTLRVGELVDWGFAVNGAASVLGATAVVVVGFTVGFNVALMCAAAAYALALVLLSVKRAWD